MIMATGCQVLGRIGYLFCTLQAVLAAWGATASARLNIGYLLSHTATCRPGFITIAGSIQVDDDVYGLWNARVRCAASPASGTLNKKVCICFEYSRRTYRILLSFFISHG
ncbi:hypothetical protein F5887DRAFT_999640 [Amanita rubescens]|nr:hypothetical protein F5887DRAFT_999640 [Amanita rubescens]